MKQCFKCGRELPLECFYKHPQMTDGHLNKCKECTKHDMALARVMQPEKHRQREAGRNKTTARKEAKRTYQKRHRAKYPERTAARTAVSNAVRDGRLIRPTECSKCGRLGKVQAHHDDYSKPLDVEWLCFACHRTYEHGQLVVGSG